MWGILSSWGSLDSGKTLICEAVIKLRALFFKAVSMCYNGTSPPNALLAAMTSMQQTTFDTETDKHFEIILKTLRLTNTHSQNTFE